jgi:hypothetical protein
VARVLLEVCLNAIFLAFYVSRPDSSRDADARDLIDLDFLLTVNVLTSLAPPQPTLRSNRVFGHKALRCSVDFPLENPAWCREVDRSAAAAKTLCEFLNSGCVPRT